MADPFYWKDGERARAIYDTTELLQRLLRKRIKKKRAENDEKKIQEYAIQIQTKRKENTNEHQQT